MKRYVHLFESDQPKKKQKTLTRDEENEEERLTSLLFSGSAPILDNLDVNNEERAIGEDKIKIGDDDEVENEVEESSDIGAAWHDDDDDEVEIDLMKKHKTKKLRDNPDETVLTGSLYEDRLRKQFENLHETPEWATVVSTEDDEDDILRSTSSLVSSKSKNLPKTVIGLTRMKDANVKDPCWSMARQVKFHPTTPLLLTAGYDKTLRLFQIDGKENTKLQSVKFSDLPIQSAFYTKGGEEIICTGKRRHFYTFDLTTGDYMRSNGIRGVDGNSFENAYGNDEYMTVLLNDTAVLLSTKTKQWIANFKMNGKVNSASFSNDNSTLSTCGSDGEVYIWDLRQRKCIHRYRDDGAVQCTAIGQSSKYTAIGSTSGIVNLYSNNDIHNTNTPKPLKEISNLTTATSHVKFNHDSQILGISSFDLENQLRLVHLPSATVFSNFPAVNEPLNHVTDFDFSPHSGFLAVGSRSGRVLLYRLNYYEAA